MMEGKLNYIPIISCDRMLLSGGRIMEKYLQEINNDRCPQEPRFMGRRTLGLQPNCILKQLR